MSVTESPLVIPNSVITQLIVSWNASSYQNIQEHKSTNPKKKGNTPKRNIDKLELDALKVLEIKLKLWLKFRYLTNTNHVNIHPIPVIVSEYENIYYCSSKNISHSKSKDDIILAILANEIIISQIVIIFN